MARDEMFKTTSFGGYDKKVVEDYISDMKKEHQEKEQFLKVTVPKWLEKAKAKGRLAQI